MVRSNRWRRYLTDGPPSVPGASMVRSKKCWTCRTQVAEVFAHMLTHDMHVLYSSVLALPLRGRLRHRCLLAFAAARPPSPPLPFGGAAGFLALVIEEIYFSHDVQFIQFGWQGRWRGRQPLADI